MTVRHSTASRGQDKHVPDSDAHVHVRPNRAARRDRNRRRRWFSLVHASRISRGARAWLMELAEHSSDEAKPVWGFQTGQAKAIGCSARQVRRYRAEAETAGLITTRRCQPEQDHEGRWHRPHTNVYVFCVPPPSSSRGKAQVTPSGHGRPLATPHYVRKENLAAPPLVHPPPYGPSDKPPETQTDPHSAIAALRAALRGS